MNDTDRDPLCKILAHAFSTTPEQSRESMERTDPGNWRVLETDRVVGGLFRIPMGQHFGGQPVPSAGVAGVAIDATARGSGTGQFLMRSLLEELHEEGVALSALYGSTTSFYRRVGYERAGARCMAKLELRDLNARSGPLEVRELKGQHDLAEELYARSMRDDGSLARGSYLWKRIRRPRGKFASGYGFFSGDRLEGYAYLQKRSSKMERNSYEATDLLLTTPEATRTLMGFLAGHRALYQSFRWPCLPDSHLFLGLDEPWSYSLMMEEHWLLRVVHLVKALESRGYPSHLSGELHLRVSDPVLSSNSGDWVLKVSGGEGQVTSGGRAELVLDVGPLASLYTGFSSGRSLYRAGLAKGPAEVLAFASQLFAGTPCMTDRF